MGKNKLKIIGTVLCCFLIGSILMGAFSGRIWTSELALDADSVGQIPSISNVNQALIYQDPSKKTIMVSQNGSNYIQLQQRKNFIMNGDFNIWQRGSPFTSISTTQYTADRWKLVQAVPNLGTYTAKIDTHINSDTGSRSYQNLEIDCTHVNTALQAGSLLLLQQTIELQAVPYATIANGFTVSFISDMSSGTYGISFQTGSAAYVTTFIITTSPQIVMVNVPININGGPNNFSTGTIEVDICLVGGSNFQTTASATNVWSGAKSGLYTTSSQFNFGSSTSDVFRIGDIQLEEGQQATAFEYTPYQQELAMCQRYAYVIVGTGGGANIPITFGGAVTGTTMAGNIYFPVPMRIGPALTFGAAGTIGHIFSGSFASSVAVTTNPPTTTGYLSGGATVNSACVLFTGSTGASAAGSCGMVYFNSSNTTSDMLIFNSDY